MLEVDIIADDRSGNPVLVVEVKNHPAGKDTVARLAEFLDRLGPSVPFAMLVDPDRIHLYRWDGERVSPLASFDTAPVLRTYDPEYGQKRIFERYMITLVEAWLRDLAYGWKSPNPPAAEQLRPTGLPDRLAGGTTRSEVAIRAAALP
jgi:hypothetical protein